MQKINSPVDNFIDRLKFYIDGQINESVAKNNTIENVITTTLNGYRGLGINQFMQYQNTLSEESYTVGSFRTPVVSR